MYDLASFPLHSEILRASGPTARKGSFPEKSHHTKMSHPRSWRRSSAGTVDVKGERRRSFRIPGQSLHDPGVHRGLLAGCLRRGRRWRFAGQWRRLLLGNRSIKKPSCYWCPQRSTCFCWCGCCLFFWGLTWHGSGESVWTLMMGSDPSWWPGSTLLGFLPACQLPHPGCPAATGFSDIWVYVHGERSPEKHGITVCGFRFRCHWFSNRSVSREKSLQGMRRTPSLAFWTDNPGQQAFSGK